MKKTNELSTNQIKELADVARGFIDWKSKKWGLKWQSKNKLDGITEHLIFDNRLPALFHTKKEAIEYRNKRYGYIKERKDLRSEPFGWKLPKVIKVKVSIKEIK